MTPSDPNLRDLLANKKNDCYTMFEELIKKRWKEMQDADSLVPTETPSRNEPDGRFKRVPTEATSGYFTPPLLGPKPLIIPRPSTQWRLRWDMSIDGIARKCSTTEECFDTYAEAQERIDALVLDTYGNGTLFWRLEPPSQ